MNKDELLEEMRTRLQGNRNLRNEHLLQCLDPLRCMHLTRLAGRIESWEMAVALVEDVTATDHLHCRPATERARQSCEKRPGENN